MDVVDYLRVPDVVNLVDGDLRLNLSEGIPVAVVIVAHILVIELRRTCSFVWRSQRLVIPVLNDVYTIGIERRDKQNYGVVQNALNFRIIRGCKSVRNKHA